MRQFWPCLKGKENSDSQGRVAYECLARHIDTTAFKGGRILEIGPKHGMDSLLLAALCPSELVLVDLPSKEEMVQSWISEVRKLCPTTLIIGNLLHFDVEARQRLGTFDLVFCAGVLYHNLEQYRLIRRLFQCLKSSGHLILETAITRNEKLRSLNAVEIFWPDTYRDSKTITHLPSRRAVSSWMEMAGFVDVKELRAYTGRLKDEREVFWGRRSNSESKPYLGYAELGSIHPQVVPGDF